jgi:hypothetical protein
MDSTWTLPGHVVATTSTDPSRLQTELREWDNELKRLIMEAERRPQLRNIDLKYKLSDWEARTKTPIRLPVQGYIQTANHTFIDFDHLNLWFTANWNPVLQQLRRDQTYKAWARKDPEYRHVQVSGEPAVAKAGRIKEGNKKGTQVPSAAPFSPSVPFLVFRFSLFRRTH